MTSTTYKPPLFLYGLVRITKDSNAVVGNGVFFLKSRLKRQLLATLGHSELDGRFNTFVLKI